MRHTAISLALCLLAGPVVAGPMENACLARGTWDAATCACMQSVAEETLSSDQQELAAEFFARRTTSQKIAAQQGAAAAGDFLQDLAGFMSASSVKCGAP